MATVDVLPWFKIWRFQREPCKNSESQVIPDFHPFHSVRSLLIANLDFSVKMPKPKPEELPKRKDNSLERIATKILLHLPENPASAEIWEVSVPDLNKFFKVGNVGRIYEILNILESLLLVIFFFSSIFLNILIFLLKIWKVYFIYSMPDKNISFCDLAFSNSILVKFIITSHYYG